MNSYRNWHYQVSNEIKRRFKSDISMKLNFRFDGKIKIEYFYFAPDKRKRDLMNVISVVDKFFQDAMVETGCIESDDLSVVVEVNSCYMGIDRQDPRLDVIISNI
jgi:Holliday junction resolvase RusA-like endonuclease